jgi:Uma2 family endonuclease
MGMPADAAAPLMTSEELERLDLPDKSTELVRGRLIVREPPGTEHGRIQANLAYFISHHVRRNQLGAVFGQDTGFKIESNPDTVRAPDVAFLERTRASLVRPRGYAALAPDLVVEILSPEDRPGEVLTKVGAWLDAGVKLVWVIDPERRVARVYRENGDAAIVPAGDSLDGEDVIPGFSCALSQVFD